MSRKEIEHRACLAPWPDRSYEAPPFISVTAALIKEEAEKFGLEVIDIEWMRTVLAAVAEHLASEERLAVGSACQSCGVEAKHVAHCSAVKRDGEAVA